MSRVEFEILERVGVLDTSENGWAFELNIVTWNNGEPKYDIRHWSEDHVKMTKGITLTEPQAQALYEALGRRFK